MKLLFRNCALAAALKPAMYGFLVLLMCLASLAQIVPVLTQHNDNARTGQNLGETYLTLNNVNTAHFGELFTQSVDGFIVAEPLYVPNLQINGATHNVVFVVTLHDSVYAFDADNSTGSNSSPLWHTSFINPPSVTTVPIADQGCPANGYTEMGILGTPVIDPMTNIMYVVVKTLENGNYLFRLHALNILNGQEMLGGPVVIQGSYVSDGQPDTFAAQHRMQRPALLLLNGTVYIAFGNMGCKGYSPSTGWVFAYSATNLKQAAVLDVGPTRPYVPGIWMGGFGPAADGNGNVYLATGDGVFDYNIGGLDYGDTLLKLNLSGGVFGLVDYFTPFNQADLYANDLDLGSGGAVLLPTQTGKHPNEAIIAGKQGMIYLVDCDSMGEYDSTADQVVQELSFDPNAEIEILGGATYWNGLVYFAGQKSPVRAFSITNGLLSTSPFAATQSNYNFSNLFSISANSNQNGILWGVQQQNNASHLIAFNAMTLKTLYASTAPRDAIYGSTYLTSPMVANGRVYVGTRINVTVMGLFGTIANIGGGAQTGPSGTKLPKALRVKVTDAYSGTVIPGVVINFSDGGSGGSFSTPSPVTNSQGIATTNYTLPSQAGTYAVTAASATFTAAHFNETAN
jgi:hypothetical protein